MEPPKFDQFRSANLLATIEANVDNDKLSDSDFREFIRNSLPLAYNSELRKEKAMSTTMTVSSSLVKEFWKERRTDQSKLGLRIGQHFHQFMKLDKITSEPNKLWCDRLYEQDGDLAIKTIESITDYQR